MGAIMEVRQLNGSTTCHLSFSATPGLIVACCVCVWGAGEKLANPITPLYKDPASVEAELQLQSHMQRAAAAQVQAQLLNNAMGRQAGHKQGSRGHVADPRDARDAEIDQVCSLTSRRGDGIRG